LEGAEGLTDEQTLAIRAKAEDIIVRTVRTSGHCDAALPIMRAVLGVTILGDDQRRSFYDTDGVDCWHRRWVDGEGYDKNGYNERGYDRDGFDANGMDQDGFNRDGFDANGVHRGDLGRYMYDRNGRTIDGWDRNGINQGTRRTRADQARHEAEEAHLYIFDRTGRTFEGFDWYGANIRGGYQKDHNLADYPDLRTAAYERLAAARVAASTTEASTTDTAPAENTEESA